MDAAQIKNTLINFLVPIICLSASVALFVIVIYPSYRKVPLLRADIETKTKLRDVLNDKKSRLSRFVDFKAILDENSALVDKVIPADQNIPGLLDQIDQLARESGFDVTKLSYSVSDTNGSAEDVPAYQSVLVSLGADGTYSQFLSFLKSVENSARVVNITNFRFNVTSTNDFEGLSFTFILSAPFLEVQSTAVTDEPLGLDLSSGEFVSFINKVKGLRYFEHSGDELKVTATAVPIEEIDKVEETTESEK